MGRFETKYAMDVFTVARNGAMTGQPPLVTADYVGNGRSTNGIEKQRDKLEISLIRVCRMSLRCPEVSAKRLGSEAHNLLKCGAL